MRIVILLIVIGGCLVSETSAKDIEGCYITQTNDTVRVTMDIPINVLADKPKYFQLQKKLEYFGSDNEKITLLPHEAKEFSFVYQGENIRMVSRRNPDPYRVEEGKAFVRILTDGKMKLFDYYAPYTVTGYNSATGLTSGEGGQVYFLEKSDGLTIWWPKNYLGKAEREYFSDCPEIAAKIKSKAYRVMHVMLIVNKYNALCGSETN